MVEYGFKHFSIGKRGESIVSTLYSILMINTCSTILEAWFMFSNIPLINVIFSVKYITQTQDCIQLSLH